MGKWYYIMIIAVVGFSFAPSILKEYNKKYDKLSLYRECMQIKGASDATCRKVVGLEN